MENKRLIEIAEKAKKHAKSLRKVGYSVNPLDDDDDDEDDDEDDEEEE